MDLKIEIIQSSGIVLLFLEFALTSGKKKKKSFLV